MARAPWACLVYVGADDRKVRGAVNANLLEMEKVGSQAGLTIAAQIDWGGRGERVVITSNGPRLVSQLQQSPSGRAAVFREFLEWGTQEFDADRHMLVLLGHGQGVGYWIGPPAKGEPKSGDPESLVMSHVGRGLSIKELAQTLRRFWNGRRKLAVLGFNSCFMNAAEIAYELRDSVRYVVGSQAQMALPGWDFKTVLGLMASQPTIDPRKVSRRIVSATAKKHSRLDLPVVMSALDLGRAAALGRSIRKLVDHLKTAAEDPTERELIRTAMWKANFDEVVRDFPDLWGFCKALAKRTRNIGLARAARAASLAVRRGKLPVVYWKRDFRSRFLMRMGGLSIYFKPLPEGERPEVRVWRGSYQNLSFCKDTGWDRFMYGFRWSTEGGKSMPKDVKPNGSWSCPDCGKKFDVYSRRRRSKKKKKSAGPK